MDNLLIGLLGIAVAIFLGLIGIAIAVAFGLRGFETRVMGELSIIREKVVGIQQVVEKVWDVVLRSPAFGAQGTVERDLKNLGKTKITARPDVKMTVYLIEVEKPVLQQGLIVTLIKGTELEAKENEMFGGQVPAIAVSLPNWLRIHVPSTEPRVCTEYISLLLKWLDSTYFDSLQTLRDYEEPIQV